jgi:hypothetical protein
MSGRLYAQWVAGMWERWYKPHGVAFSVYVLGLWRNNSYSVNEEYLQEIEKVAETGRLDMPDMPALPNNEQPSTPPIISEPPADFSWGASKKMWITPKPAGANVRRAPDKDAKPPMTTLPATRVKVEMSANGWTNDGERWRRVVLSAGLTGYIAESALEKIEDAPATGPLPPPPVPPAENPPPPPAPPAPDNDILRENVLAALREMEVSGEAAARNYQAAAHEMQAAAQNLLEAATAHEMQAEGARRFQQALAELWNIPGVPAAQREVLERVTQTAELAKMTPDGAEE